MWLNTSSRMTASPCWMGCVHQLTQIVRQAEIRRGLCRTGRDRSQDYQALADWGPLAKGISASAVTPSCGYIPHANALGDAGELALVGRLDIVIAFGQTIDRRSTHRESTG